MTSRYTHTFSALLAILAMGVLAPRPSFALPDLIVQEGVFNLDIVTRNFQSNDCVVLEGCAQPGTRRLLRLNTENRNIGTTDVVLGNPENNTNFVYNSCEGHYRFPGYADYRLVDSNGVVAAGHKQGFCLEDVNRYDENSPLHPKYDCGNQGIQAGWSDVYSQFLDCQWIDITDVEPGSYTLEVEVNPLHRIVESDYSNNTTTAPVEVPAFPNISIDAPSDGSVSLARLVNVTGLADSLNGITSVVVTNDRGGSATATLAGDTWSVNNFALKVGTNTLYAIATDTISNSTFATTTVIRVNTNYVDTTLRTVKVSLALNAAANSDSLSFSGALGAAVSQFDAANDALEVQFGDMDATLPPHSIVNGKFKGSISPSNQFTSVKLDLAKRTIAFSAAGFTLTNLDAIPVTISLGTNEFGPDEISFPAPPARPGKAKWAYGKQPTNVDQFFLTKGTLTADTFNLTGTLHANVIPDALANEVTFGIGSFEQALPSAGWTKGNGNSYSYKPPVKGSGNIQKMKIDFDKGTWSVSGDGADLSFLFSDPSTHVRLEVEDYAADLPVTFTVNGATFVY